MRLGIVLGPSHCLHLTLWVAVLSAGPRYPLLLLGARSSACGVSASIACPAKRSIFPSRCCFQTDNR